MNKEDLKKKTQEINDILYAFLPEPDLLDELIVSAMNYSVQAGGKRIRPLLMQESYRTFSYGDADEKILHAFMAAMECIHTYSLCHDDLPAMDNDMYRRGSLTTHAKYGEAFGILAGDGLLNLAYEIIAEAMKDLDGEMLKRAAASFAVLAEKAGYRGMVGGQTLDVYFDKTGDPDGKLEHLEYIYANKTAALLEASLMIGAILSGAPEETVLAMQNVGRDVGFAFQIRDDILDLTGTQEVIGKPVGSDEKNGKMTVVSFQGLEKAKTEVARYSEHALNLLKELPYHTDQLADIIQYLIDRDS